MRGVRFTVVASLYLLFVSLSRFNNFSDEGVRWGRTLNGGRTRRGSRVYPTEWSTYRL
ncbi:uncharacterized protein DS421_6g192520 [Arachis hypogaea]|nr:uncharacterized protein DS421_6g192520 [Arachis hypogaea]